jgi:hypothetical protein
MRLGELPAAFIRSGRGPRPTKDREFALRALRRFAAFVGKGIDLAEIGPEQIERFAFWRIDESRWHNLRFREWINRELKIVRTALEWAADRQLIDRAPEVRRIR